MMMLVPIILCLKLYQHNLLRRLLIAELENGSILSSFPFPQVRKTQARKTQTRKTQARKTQARKTQTRKTQTRKTQTRKTQTRKTQTRKTQTRASSQKESAYPSLSLATMAHQKVCPLLCQRVIMRYPIMAQQEA